MRRRDLRAVPALALGLLLSAALVGCGDSPSGNAAAPVSGAPADAPATSAAPVAPAAPATGTSFTPVPGGPRIEFASLTHDFGVITDSESYRTTYAFRNIGDQTLTIRDVKAACGCTVPVLAKRQYQPGEGGEIEVVFDPKGKSDKTGKKLTVVSNSATSPTTELSFTSMIQPLLAMERIQRLGNMPLGADHRHTVRALYRDPDLKIKSVSVNDENIHATLVSQGEIHETSDDGVVYRADIEVLVSRDKPWGMLFAKRLTVDVNGRWRPDARSIDFSYDAFLMGSVYGKIHASPSGLLSLGPLSPGATYSKSLRLNRPDGSPFTITGARVVESSMPGVQARVTSAGPSAYSVSLEGNVGSYRGSIRGVVSVETDVPGEERLRIPFSGQVR